MAEALIGARIFDGERLLDDHAVVIDGPRIAAVLPVGKLDPALPRQRLAGLLAPGFVDVQVNGGGGVLLNDAPSVEAIRTIGAAHRRFGTTGFLPTLITDRRERMVAAVAAVRQGLAEGVPGLLGIHLEGPFLNPERHGIHEPALIHAPAAEDLAVMTSLGVGRTLVTLAPERVPLAVIAELTAAGVIVSAGHTAAEYANVMAAIEHGLTGFTHLFNAMPPLASRAPGPVGAALDDRRSWAGVIADLHHVSAPSLRIAIAAKGVERTMLVSDAMSTVGSELAEFTLQGKRIIRVGGRLTSPEGVLAGSDLDMATAVRNVVHELRLPLKDALAMASRVPAEFLRLGTELGRLATGYRASLVLLDETLRVIATWIDGSPASVS
jgi:N-acetylglucosamine-6-phosphate deacetylase